MSSATIRKIKSALGDNSSDEALSAALYRVLVEHPSVEAPVPGASGSADGKLSRLLTAGDAEFLLAAYNIIIGRTPASDELQAFAKSLSGSIAIDRLRLISRLIASPNAKVRPDDVGGIGRWLAIFTAGQSGATNIQDLLNSDGEEFIRLLYGTLLRREPAPDELAAGIGQLLSGRAKTEFIVAVANTPEATRIAVDLPGLSSLRFREKLLALPVVGPLLRWLTLIVYLPRMERSQRSLHAVVRQLQLETAAEQLRVSSAIPAIGTVEALMDLLEQSGQRTKT